MATSKYSPDEIIVVTKSSAAVHSPRGIAAVSAAPGTKVSGLNALLKSGKLMLDPLFGDNEAAVRSSMTPMMMARAGSDTQDPGNFYVVRGDVKSRKKLVADLLNEPSVDGAYIKPGGEPPVMLDEGDGAPPDAVFEGAPAPTPDFSPRQIYLDAAPAGVDARFAWTKSGGRGDNVRIIDLEWGWNYSHEDLLVNSGGLLDGSNASDTHHGTAVLGEIGGDHNGRGVSGISPNARLSSISFVGNSSAGAIRKAADRLSAGDIILLEIHRAGPRHNFQGRDDQAGYIAIEWWPDDFAAILYASAKGIIVIEAAGNGGENLNDAIYGTRPTGFPSSWRNPFNRANPQCGAIVVGAGAPPPGTHGRSHGADRSRLGFSNHGACLDVQGWGREVTTTGYGQLQNTSTNTQYTDTFSGTSSASPIVVGVVACAQGWLKAASKPLLTPARVRTLLRSTGSAQQDEPGRPATQRIGRRPDLRALYTELFPKTVLVEKNLLKEQVKELDKLKDVKEIKEFDKQIKELDKNPKEKDKDVFEGGLGEIGGGIRRLPDAEGTDQRLAALEAAVLGLTQALQLGAGMSGAQAGAHFIDPSLRPDLMPGGYVDDEQ